jgi:ketosteroid isomerase-like protein
MSKPNLEIVREIFASAAPFTSHPRLAPDAEFDFTRLYPDQPVLHGVEQMRAFRDTGPWGPSLSFAAERYFEVDHERVLVFVRATGSGQLSGTPIETKVAQLFTLRDGLIVRVQVYPHQGEALGALGLEA